MLAELGKRRLAVAHWLPNEKLVVIAARGNLVLVVHAPFEAADFLLMPKQSLLVALLSSDVSNQYGSVTTARSDE
jgi:hypothetical protein